MRTVTSDGGNGEPLYIQIPQWYWQIQYKRTQYLNRLPPDTVWHSRPNKYNDEAEASKALAEAKRKPGAYLFAFRVMRVQWMRLVRNPRCNLQVE